MGVENVTTSHFGTLPFTKLYMCAVVYQSRITIKRSCTILVHFYSFYHDIGADISVTSVYHYQQCMLVLYCVVFNFYDTRINVSNLSLIITHGSMLLTCVSEYSEVKQLHICTSGFLFSSEPTLSTDIGFCLNIVHSFGVGHIHSNIVCIY